MVDFYAASRDRLNLGLALFTAPVGISMLYFALQDKAPFVIGAAADAALPALAIQVFLCLLVHRYGWDYRVRSKRSLRKVRFICANG